MICIAVSFNNKCTKVHIPIMFTPQIVLYLFQVKTFLFSLFTHLYEYGTF